jgi:hypothetical protein
VEGVETDSAGADDHELVVGREGEANVSSASLFHLLRERDRDPLSRGEGVQAHHLRTLITPRRK